MKKLAVRNLRLCTKDCLCLYVCPVGATDTENSVIDVTKCIGCGVCAGACPSGAISMVPVEYPPQQKKELSVLAQAQALTGNKAREEQMARQLAQVVQAPGLYRLLKAVKPTHSGVPQGGGPGPVGETPPERGVALGWGRGGSRIFPTKSPPKWRPPPRGEKQ